MRSRRRALGDELSCLSWRPVACNKAGNGRVESHTHAHAFFQVTPPNVVQATACLFSPQPRPGALKVEPHTLMLTARQAVALPLKTIVERMPACHCMPGKPWYMVQHTIALKNYMTPVFCHLDAHSL